jgi:hypothetical protein
VFCHWDTDISGLNIGPEPTDDVLSPVVATFAAFDHHKSESRLAIMCEEVAGIEIGLFGADDNF